MHTMSKNRRSIEGSQEYPVFFYGTQKLDCPGQYGTKPAPVNLGQRTKRGYGLCIKWCYFDQLER